MSLPLLTSKPRITPDVSRVEKLSVTEPAMTIVLSVIIGGDVGSYSPGVVSGILVCRFRTPLLAKVSHSLPVSAFTAKKATVVDREDNTARTVGDDLRRGGIRFGLMIRDAAAGHMLERRIGLQLRIKMPLLFTAGGVQREQTLVSCTQIKRIADFNRGHFVGDFARIVGLFQIAGAEDPRFFQLVNVIRSDLFQRRIALAFLITSIGRPVFVGDRRACCGGRGVGAKRTVDLLRVVEASPRSECRR